MELIDTHCHLDQEPLGNDIDGVLVRARSAGITEVIVPAYDPPSWNRLLNLKNREGIHLAFGLHPWVADQTLDLYQLEDLLRQSNAVAVGEIGLDFKITQPGRARQIHVVTAQLKLALELNLPVILHCRSAFEELLQILGDNSTGLRGVIHAYSRGPELAQRFTALGLYIAFGGALTRPKAKRARRTAATLPFEKIVLETDAPSIGLEGVAPEETEPRHVREVATAFAGIRNISLKEVAEQTTANAQQLFRI
jgi:TatD DNase family protein